ncbi:MAG: DUF4397 domain-containing protein, partial [Bacteroidetes bacterium]|nr:DUF4397 domain-containing protein [Bacteroidota bacterium]
MENGKNLLKYFDIKNKNIVHNTIISKTILIRYSIHFFGIVLFSLFFLSCGPIYELPTTPTTPSLGSGAKIRFLNASVGSPGLDLLINNRKVLSNHTYKLVSYFIDLKPGAHEFKIRGTGSTTDILKDTLTVDSGKAYTLQLVGEFISPELLLTPRPNQYPTSGKSLVRFVNVAKELSNIDINLKTPTENFLLTEFKFKNSSSYLEVLPNKGSILVFDAGTTNLHFSSEANFELGKIYTVYILGVSGARDSTQLNAYFMDDTNPNPQTLFNFNVGTAKVRFINGDTESTPLQFLVDGSPVGSSIPFRQASAFYSLNSGTRKIKVNMGSTSGYLDTIITIEQNKFYTLLVSKAGGRLKATLYDNPPRTTTGSRSLLRFVQSSTNLDSINIKLTAIAGATTIPNLLYNQVSDFIEAAAGQNIITLSKSAIPNILSSAAFLEGGKVYTAFIFGSSTGLGNSALSLNFVKDSDSTGQSLFTFAQVQTNLRLVHGSHDSPSISLHVDDVSTVTNLTYKNATKLLGLNTGMRKVTIRAFGYPIPIYQKDYNFEADQSYLMFIANKLESVEVISLNTPQKIVPFGKSSVRFINGIYDLSGVDVRITNTSGTVSLNNIPFKEVSNYLDLNSGKNEIVVRATATQNILFTSEANLEVGVVYTACLLGKADGSSNEKYTLGFLKDLNTNSQLLTEFPPLRTNLRFVNGMTDNPSVDLLVDGTKVASSINYKLSTSITKINSGANRTFKVMTESTTSQLISKEYSIDHTKNYSFLVTNQSLNPDPILFENPSKTVPVGRSSLRIVHGAWGQGNLNVSISNSGGKINITNVAYRSVTNYFDLNSGSNEIVFTIASTSGNIILTSDAFLESDKLYTIYLLGNTSGLSGQSLSINFLVESNNSSQRLFAFESVKSQLRFINGSTDNPLLELSVDDNFVASNINYKLATGVLKVNSGTGKKIKIFEFGSSAPLLSQELTLSHSKTYTLLVANKITNLETIFFENPAKTAPTGRTSIRVVHGAYDHGAIDIHFTNSSGKYQITNAPYKRTSDYLDLNAGFNEIVITKAGTSSNLVIAADATLEANKVYTIYFLGNNSGSSGEEYSLNFLNETDPNGQFLFNFAASALSRFRTINASPNSPGLDVAFNKTKTIQNLLFGVSSGYIFLRSGIRDLEVFAGGTISPVLLSFQYLFEQNKLYTFIPMDSVTKLNPILIEDLNYTPISGKSYVRFINASPNVPPLDIKLGNPSGIVKHGYFSYQSITDYEPYDPAVMSFIFTEANTTNELLSLRGFSLVPNKAYTIIVMGFQNGSIGQNLQVKWY